MAPHVPLPQPGQVVVAVRGRSLALAARQALAPEAQEVALRVRLGEAPRESVRIVPGARRL